MLELSGDTNGEAYDLPVPWLWDNSSAIPVERHSNSGERAALVYSGVKLGSSNHVSSNHESISEENVPVKLEFVPEYV
jgi:hypothetical protein